MQLYVDKQAEFDVVSAAKAELAFDLETAQKKLEDNLARTEMIKQEHEKEIQSVKNKHSIDILNIA